MPRRRPPRPSSAAEQSMPSDSTPRSLLLLDLEAAGQLRSRARQHHRVAGCDVGRAADDRARLAAAVVHRADASGGRRSGAAPRSMRGHDERVAVPALRAARSASTSRPPMVRRRATSSTPGSPSTSSASHGRESHRWRRLELAQEAQVAVVEEADVVDPVACSIAMRSMPMPNAKPVTSLGIVADRARTRRGRPSRRRGSRASRCPCRRGRSPLLLAEHAGDVDLGARLGEREEARAQAHAEVARRTRGAGTR